MGLNVGDELQVNFHSGEIVLVHGVVSLGKLLHLLTNLALFSRRRPGQATREETLLCRKQHDVIPATNPARTDYGVPLRGRLLQAKRIIHNDIV